MTRLLLSTCRSVRWSRQREDVLRLLLERGPMTEIELARALGVAPSRLHGLLLGIEGAYDVAHGVLRLGLVERRHTRLGAELALTELGALQARLVVEAREAGRRI